MPIDALSVLCAQLTRDLLAIAKFLFILFSVSEFLFYFTLILFHRDKILVFIKFGMSSNFCVPLCQPCCLMIFTFVAVNYARARLTYRQLVCLSHDNNASKLMNLG